MQVDKQCAHFYGVTINDQQAQSGIVVRVTSAAQSKFKVKKIDEFPILIVVSVSTLKINKIVFLFLFVHALFVISINFLYPLAKLHLVLFYYLSYFTLNMKQTVDTVWLYRYYSIFMAFKLFL